MSERIDVEVFFDFACPYVHSAAVWLDEVRRQLGDDAPWVTWRFFPLEQVNAPDNAELAVWDLPPERRSRGRDSMHAAAAARKQGDDAFSRFHSALLALKHERGEDHGLQQTIQTAAVTAGLDLTRFNDDLANRELLAEIRTDYTAGRDDHGVFGTPTFVFGEGQSAYIKLLPAPPPEDAVAVWEDFVRAVCDRPYLQEIKRPRRQQ